MIMILIYALLICLLNMSVVNIFGENYQLLVMFQVNDFSSFSFISVSVMSNTRFISSVNTGDFITKTTYTTYTFQFVMKFDIVANIIITSILALESFYRYNYGFLMLICTYFLAFSVYCCSSSYKQMICSSTAYLPTGWHPAATLVSLDVSHRVQNPVILVLYLFLYLNLMNKNALN